MTSAVEGRGTMLDAVRRVAEVATVPFTGGAGYDLPVIRAMKENTSVQIAASGRAGKLEHFFEAVEAGATILLAASVFHFHLELKNYLRRRGVSLCQ
jgi:imidazole glycerol phosphate synthase subunit HisF